MATGSKIVRRNFAMKIGSSKEVRAGLQKKKSTSFAKSTSEIVKSYINSSYKTDSASNFWNELTQPKIAAPREENKGPLRLMRSILSTSQPTIIPVASAGGLSSLASESKRSLKSSSTKLMNDDNKAYQTSAVASIAASRRLLKNSDGCYRIINNRRFGSSASSSCGSIFRRHDDRRQVSSFKRTISGGFIERLYNTQPKYDVKNSLATISSSKYLLSLRNQNIAAPLGSVTDAVKVSSTIQQELMPIDKTIRERISLRNAFLPKITPEPRDNDPMSGWHHPPSPEMLTNRNSDRLLYRSPAQTPERSATATASAAAVLRQPDRFSGRRIVGVSKIPDKDVQDEQRLRVSRKPTRLTLSCTPPLQTEDISPSMSAAGSVTPKNKLQSAQSAPAVSMCDSGMNSDSDAPQRKMIHMTARRINTVEHQPVRRFSLRRPPTANLTEITPPAPGPAAESLIMHQNRNLTSRSSPMSTFASAMNPNVSRYNHFSSRPY